MNWVFLGNVSHVAPSMCSSKNTINLSLHPVSNIELFPTHMELELDVLGVARKLVKDVVQLWWQDFEKNLKLLITGCPNSKRPNFGFKEFCYSIES